MLWYAQLTGKPWLRGPFPCTPNIVDIERTYEEAFSQWRRHRSTSAMTMGILYWQLNSIWQGPDWSTIEYDGRLLFVLESVGMRFVIGKGSGSSYLVASDADLEVVQDPIDDMLQSEYGQAEQEMDGTTPPDTPASHLGPPAEPE